MYDVVIIGAGIVGAMTARLLSKFSLSVCVLEKDNDVAMGATKANSAIVHAGFDAECGTLKAKLNVKGSQMMPKICEELGVAYKNNGSLVIGFNGDDKKTISELFNRGEKNGVKGLEILDKDALSKIEPNISQNATCALYAPTGAVVSPYELAIAAMGNAMDNGAELKTEF
ncbi:MAG: FAD-dependent oxidoreductase, partial [Clostridia bacterium]|nr:FAD-dependent oxidoreductase [Clostridia bacterium]